MNFSYSPDCPHCRNVEPVFESLATNFKRHSDRVRFGQVNCIEEDSLCTKAGVTGFPTFFYHKVDSDKVEYNGDRSLDDFSEFVSTQAGLYYRRKEKLLKEVTPDDWNETVMNPSKNVLVAFTAPWCGHCQRLKPQMEMAAQSFKPEENISFVYIDAEQYAEFCEPYEVRGYPTVKYFPAYKAGDEEKLAQIKNEELEAARAKETRSARKAELQALKAAADAPEATEEAKASFGEAEQAELQKIKDQEDEESMTPAVVRKGANAIENFSGSRDAGSLVNWMNRHTGTLRTVGGGIDTFAGLERDIAEPLVVFVHAVTNTSLPKEPTPETETENNTETNTENNTTEQDAGAATKEPSDEREPPPPVEDARKDVLVQLENVPSAYVRSQYLRYMDMLEKKGLKAVDAERERLTRMLEEGHFTDRKLMELTVRKNVMSLFMTV